MQMTHNEAIDRLLAISDRLREELRPREEEALGMARVELDNARLASLMSQTAAGHPSQESAQEPAPTPPQITGVVGSNPPPVANTNPSCHDLVMLDLWERKAFGLKKYGTLLQPHNGRDFLLDAYEEQLDHLVYLRGALYERNGK